MIDFQTVQVDGSSLFFVLPTQVHQPVHQDAAKGWFIGVDASIMPTYCRDVLEGQLMLQHPIKLSPLQLRQFNDMLNLIFEKRQEPNNGLLYRPAIHAHIQAFLLEAATMYNQMLGVNSEITRSYQLLHGFKKLLVTEIKNLKSPSAYALRLNVTESYLNEFVKKISGFTVSYWIRNEIIMEAKRLLYYTELTSKEIAYDLAMRITLILDESLLKRLECQRYFSVGNTVNSPIITFKPLFSARQAIGSYVRTKRQS